MSRPVLILLVSALVMLGPFTNNIMVPSLPALATDLRIGFGDAQAILSIFMVGFAAGQLFVGPMSDRFGRKPVLTMSLALFIVASVLCAFAPDLCSLCAARLVQALGASATLSVGRAIVRDSFASDKMAQVYAYVGTALALGPIVGPIFGGVIEITAGWRSVFIFLAAFGCLMLLTIVFLLRETNTNLNRDATRPARRIGNYATLLSTRLYMLRAVQYNLLRRHLRFYVLQRLYPDRLAAGFPRCVRRALRGNGQRLRRRNPGGEPDYPPGRD